MTTKAGEGHPEAAPSPTSPAAHPSLPPRRRKWPSAGFVTVSSVYVAVALFFAWGLSTPPLDRVWTLHHELKSGRRGAPKDGDRRILIDSMERHAELAAALLSGRDIGLISAHSEGWIATPEATIVRTKGAQERWLLLEVSTPRDLLPFDVEVQGVGWRKRAKIAAHGIHDVELPSLTKSSELIILRLRGRDLRDDPSVLGVRVSFATQRIRVAS